MKSIGLLYEDLKNAPSLLSVMDETRFMMKVMLLRPEDIARDGEVFFKIPDRLEDSHTIGWGHTAEDPVVVEVFERFALFLEELVTYMPSQQAWLTSAAENFAYTDPVSGLREGSHALPDATVGCRCFHPSSWM